MSVSTPRADISILREHVSSVPRPDIATARHDVPYGKRQDAARLVERAFSGKLKGYVLGLRSNPGGLFDVAVSVADAFLDQGQIVSVRGRDSERAEHFNARPGALINGKPLIVLINGGSASGSLSKSVPKSDLGDDDAAIERAKQYVDGCDVDVWHHDRLVARIEAGAVKRPT